MKLTCLVTAQCAEGESVEIEFTCDSNWRHKLRQILTLLDNRLAEINMRVVKDTHASEALSPGEYKTLLDIIAMQFPYHDISTTYLSFHDIRLLIRKMTSQKEHIALRYDASLDDDIATALDEAFSILDGRMIETNERDIAAMKLLSSCTPDEKHKLQMILDCLYGRADSRYVAMQLASNSYLEASKTAKDDLRKEMTEAIREEVLYEIAQSAKDKDDKDDDIHC